MTLSSKFDGQTCIEGVAHGLYHFARQEPLVAWIQACHIKVPCASSMCVGQHEGCGARM
jgi:hypothetical protein